MNSRPILLASALLLGAWWWFLPPGLCIAFLGAGLALINFGIDEIANPRLRTGNAPKSTATKKSAPAKKEREVAAV